MKFTKEASPVWKCFKKRTELWTPFNLVGHFTRNRLVTSNKMKITIFITNCFLICTIYLLCSKIITRINTMVSR